MSKTLQTLNGQNKLVLWAGRISECHSSGQNVKSWCKENGTCEQTCYKWQLCIPGTDLLQSLNWIEQEIADKPAEERYTERLEQAKPVLDAVLSWANTRTVAPKSAPGILCCLYSLNSVATAVLELRLAAKEIYKARTSIAQFENQRYCLEICCQLYTAYPWEKEVLYFL